MTELSIKRALYIIINAGFSGQIIDLIHEAGGTGATILHARGTGAMQQSILGISVDSDKEIVLSVVDKDVAEKIIASIREHAGKDTPARAICFSMPVDKYLLTSGSNV